MVVERSCGVYRRPPWIGEGCSPQCKGHGVCQEASTLRRSFISVLHIASLPATASAWRRPRPDEVGLQAVDPAFARSRC